MQDSVFDICIIRMYKYSSMNTKPSWMDREIRPPYPIAVVINAVGGSWIPLVGLIVAAAIILVLQQRSQQRLNKESAVRAKLEVTQKGD